MQDCLHRDAGPGNGFTRPLRQESHPATLMCSSPPLECRLGSPLEQTERLRRLRKALHPQFQADILRHETHEEQRQCRRLRVRVERMVYLPKTSSKFNRIKKKLPANLRRRALRRPIAMSCGNDDLLRLQQDLERCNVYHCSCLWADHCETTGDGAHPFV